MNEELQPLGGPGPMRVVRDDEITDLSSQVVEAVVRLALAVLDEAERRLTAELERLRG